ncbi:hypothetical protein AUC71_03355 [Methyloceanibacter marginalis]|uniref:Leucine-binding protein domain-containing protein n=1 Tax=Methyloceanibacter marginalis TaxID=1774971 RepID=A0A1E3W4G2_9HYPH|nr:ABC transporter substrate-binding protein [Methyloceanibacter marginalis]ODS00666.1 hypothetical protein AUC71_03355 [Methyloceanibacter marginalis]
MVGSGARRCLFHLDDCRKRRCGRAGCAPGQRNAPSQRHAQSHRAPAKPDEAAEKAPAPAEDKPAKDKAGDKKLMRVYYLGKEYDEPLPLSYAEEIITDKGIQGARLMEKEANQAGNFIGYEFKLEEGIVPKDGDVVAKAKEALAAGHRFILADLEPDDLLAVADLPEAKNALILNIRSSATKLRQEECRRNVFHIIPDYAMRADALAQYLIWKKWPRWFVIRRDTEKDQDYLAQVKRRPPAMAARWSRTMSTTCRPARETSTPAISRSRRRCPWRPKARRSTTWSGSSIATTISAII